MGGNNANHCITVNTTDVVLTLWWITLRLQWHQVKRLLIFLSVSWMSRPLSSFWTCQLKPLMASFPFPEDAQSPTGNSPDALLCLLCHSETDTVWHTGDRHIHHFMFISVSVLSIASADITLRPDWLMRYGDSLVTWKILFCPRGGGRGRGGWQ